MWMEGLLHPWKCDPGPGQLTDTVPLHLVWEDGLHLGRVLTEELRGMVNCLLLVQVALLFGQ